MKTNNDSLETIGEFELIENIKSWINSKQKTDTKNIIGIGDDAAVIKTIIGSKNFLASVDTLAEGTHFTREITNFYELGWKTLAVNVSDIAAMGGVAKYALVSFACPKTLKIEHLKNFYFGFKELAEITNVILIGGDTVRTYEKIVVSATIIGETLGAKYCLRSGAEAGNLVLATGTFGDAAFGLNQLLHDPKTRNYFTQRFNKPMPRFKAGQFLGKNNLATAMIDVSDGFAFSLNEIAEKSKKGIIIYEDKIPIVNKLKKDKNYLNFALYGGEDYELIFCSKEKNLDKILTMNEKISVIGKVCDDFIGVKMIDKHNLAQNLDKKGYNAF